MKTIKNTWMVVGSFLVMFLAAQIGWSQTYNVNNAASKMTIEGTSNIHDWEVDAKEFQGNLQAEMKDGQLVEIKKLDFAVVAESMKSGKSGMDKNMYKALNTNKVKRITYQLESVKNIDCISSNECKVNTRGYLSIAGTKKPVDLVFDAKVSGDRITLSGDKTINMTQFNVDPPTAMFGTITTGDEVKINFQTVFTK